MSPRVMYIADLSMLILWDGQIKMGLNMQKIKWLGRHGFCANMLGVASFLVTYRPQCNLAILNAYHKEIFNNHN